MINEYVSSPLSGWLQARGNLYFLRPSAFDIGGRFSSGESNAFIEYDNSAYHYRALDMEENSRVTIGGSYSNYPNIQYIGSNIQYSVAAIYFSASNGYGEVDFATSTGAGIAGIIQETPVISPLGQEGYLPSGSSGALNEIETPTLYINNRTDTSGWSKNKFNWISSAQDISAYTVQSTGALKILGDMSANVIAQSGATGSTGSGNVLDYIPDNSTTEIKYIDFSSNTKANAAAFRSSSFSVASHFTGLLYATSNVFSLTQLKNSGNISGNQISASGIWADNSVSVAGRFYGSIFAQTQNITLANDTSVVDSGKAVKVSWSNNDIGAYGIRARAVAMGSFETKNAQDTNIVAEVSNIHVFATGTSGDGAGLSMTGNGITSTGIFATSFTVNGLYTGSIAASINNVVFNYSTPGSATWGSNNLGVYGIRASEAITIKDNMRGSISATYLNTLNRTLFNNIEAYGIYADSLTVQGSLGSTITVNVNKSGGNEVNSSGDYICGIRVNTLKANSFDGTISVTSDYSSSPVAVGMYIAKKSTGNGDDGVLDITGNISVSGRNTVGVMGFQQGMDLRVSGSVISTGTSTGYSFFAGLYDYANGRTRYNTDDRLEIAAGAYVKGDIELFNGKNALIIDSNARVNGNVNATLGTVNVEFVLNDNALAGVTAGYENEAILYSETALNSTVTVTVNMNSVDFSQSGTRSFRIYSGDLSGWSSRSVDFKYQGLTGTMKVGDSAIIGGVTVSTRINGNSVYFEIESNGSVPAGTTPLSSITGLNIKSNADQRTVTLSWNSVGAGSYEVEYRIAGGKTIVQMVSGKNTITLNNIDAGQKIEWRVRQNIGQGDQTSIWSDGSSLTQGDETYVYSKVTDVDYVLGESAASAVSTLKWEPGEEYSNGVVGYVVRYYQTLENTGADWSSAHILKYVTSKELLVSGLNNLQYFYWQVQAVDEVDASGNWIIKNGNWVNGQVFKVYADDNTPPWFVGNPVTGNTVKWANPDDIKLGTVYTMDPTLTWNKGFDDRSGVSRYTIQFRKKDSDDEWISVDIPVTDESKQTYSFRLSDYIKANPQLGLSLLESAVYEYQLIAVDYVGKKSDPSLNNGTIGYWTPDTIAPVFDTGKITETYSWTGGSTTDTFSVTVRWDAASDEGGSGLFYYQLRYRQTDTEDWITVPLIDRWQTSKSLTLDNTISYDYEISAFDVAGNQSSVASGLWYGDTYAPEFNGTSLTVTNSYDPSKQSTVLVFTWPWATDVSAGPVSGLKDYVLTIYDKNGKAVGSYTTTELSKTITVGKDSSLKLADGIYSWTVTAYDRAGNGNPIDGENFLIDTKAPVGSFTSATAHGQVTYTSSTNTSTGTISGFGNLPSGDITTTQEVSDIWVNFSFTGDFEDASGDVRYVIQISDNAAFTGNRTYDFVSDSTSLTLNSTNGFGAGCMAKSNLVYWRVQAMDTMGNRTGVWYNGNTFYFADDKTYEYIRDTVAPTAPGSTTVSVSNPGTGYNTTYLYWGSSYDLFGVEKYEVRYSYTANGKKVEKTITVNAVNTGTSFTINKSANADGIYSWSVRAIDYVGHTSEWVSGDKFLIDTIAPTNVTLKVDSTDGSRDVIVSWTSSFDLNLSYYELRITSKSITDSTTQTEYVSVSSSQLSYALYNQLDGTYTISVRAVDARGNTSNWSNAGSFVVDTANEPGSTFANATVIGFGSAAAQTHTVGGSDTADMFKFTLDNAASVSITLSGVETLIGKNSGVKLNLYNESGKKVKSLSVKSGTKSLDKLLLDITDGESTYYYIQVVSGNSASIGKYTLSADKTDFPKATENVDWEKASDIGTLTGTGTGSVDADGWVGFGDAADYYTFTVETAGTITIDADVQAGMQVKVSLYVENNGKYKRLKSVTVKNDLDNIFKTGVLTGVGTYYLVVEAADKGKGKYNGSYDLVVKDKFFEEATPNSSFAYADQHPTTLSTTMNTPINGWVGYGDAADYYLLQADGPGSIDFSVNGLDPNSKITVSLYDSNNKKIKSYSVTDKKPLSVNDMLFKGNCYLVVESGDKGKGKQNTDYSVSIVYDKFPTETISNNTQDKATSVNFETIGSAEVAKTSDWVGYGDAIDFFSFELDAAGQIDLDLSNLTNSGLRIGSDLKVKLYDSTGKMLKLDKNLTSSELEIGTYAVSVEISKPEKNWTGYDLSITKLA